VLGDVHTYTVGAMLRSLERHCVPSDGILEGLGITHVALQPPYGWCSWDDYAVVLERIRERVGGPEALESLVGDAIATNPVMTVLASTLINPRLLYTEFIQSVGHRMCRCVGVRVRELDDGRISLIYRLVHGYRPCRDYFVASRGGLRYLPRLLGAEYASVEAKLTGDHAEYIVTPPASRTVAARLGRTLSSLSPWRWSPADIDYDGPWGDAVRGAVEIAGLEIAIRQSLDDEGPALAANATTAELFDRLASFLDQHFCCATVGLWSMRGPNGAPELLHACGSLADDGAARYTRDLVLEGRVVGRIRADLSLPTDPAIAACLDTLFTWAALGLERCLNPEEAQAEEPSPRRAAIVEADLRLTRRQRQVVERLLAGKSNRQIADELGVKTKTVEVHVGRVMHKANVSSRAALVAKLSRIL
jgi:DNA-binding CsgD family transcriptional regulator